MSQERLLTAHTSHEKNINELTFKICQKTKRKKEDLLLNKTDIYRMKRQAIDLIENKKKLEEKYGDKSWYIGLRRPDNFKGTRYTLLNGGTDTRPTYFTVKENSSIKVDNIQRPMTSSVADFRKFSGRKYFEKTTNNMGLNVNDLVEANQIIVEGRNLIDEEELLAKRMNGRKILYKETSKTLNEMDNKIQQLLLGSVKNPLLFPPTSPRSPRPCSPRDELMQKDKGLWDTEEVIQENYDRRSFIKNYRVKSSK